MREYPNHPLPGVGGVLLRNGKILLARRKTEPGRGYWAVPGGLVELGETLEEAVRREMLEETGLEVVPLYPIYADTVLVRDPDGKVKYHYVLVDLLCKQVGGRLRPGGDVKEVRWVELNHALKLKLADSTRKLIESLASGFRISIRNRDVDRVLIGVPRGHKHKRVILKLRNGSIIILHEATAENLARAMVEVEMHPSREAISLRGRELDIRKQDYDKYQLLEEDLPEDLIVDEITEIIEGESPEDSES